MKQHPSITLTAIYVLTVLLMYGSVAHGQARVRGTIEKADGNTLWVKSWEGESLPIKLKDGTAVTGVAKAAIADIRQNSSIRIIEMPRSECTWTVTAVDVTEAGSNANAQRARVLTPCPPRATCTPGVRYLTMDGTMLTVMTINGEKKISTNDTPIIRFVEGDKSELKPGAKIIGAFTKLPDGSLEATGINFGLDGIVPPNWLEIVD
jgi:hypothetical protein